MVWQKNPQSQTCFQLAGNPVTIFCHLPHETQETPAQGFISQPTNVLQDRHQGALIWALQGIHRKTGDKRRAARGIYDARNWKLDQSTGGSPEDSPGSRGPSPSSECRRRVWAGVPSWRSWSWSEGLWGTHPEQNQQHQAPLWMEVRSELEEAEETWLQII